MPLGGENKPGYLGTQLPESEKNPTPYLDLFDSLDKEGKDKLLTELKQEDKINKMIDDQEKILENKEKAKELTDSQKFIVSEYSKYNDKDKVNKYIDILKKINKLETLNTVKTKDRKYSKEWENAPWYRIDKGTKSLIYNVSDIFHKDTYGMKDKADEYKKLVLERRELETPIAKNTLEKVTDELKLTEDEMKSYGEMVQFYPLVAGGRAKTPVSIPLSELDESEIKDNPVFVGKDYVPNPEKQKKWIDKKEIYASTISILNRQKDALEKFINGDDGIFDGLSTQKDALISAGTIPLLDKLAVSKVKMKKLKNKPLTPEEDKLLKAYNISQQVGGLNLGVNRFLYRTGQGTGNSLVLVEQMGLTAPIGGIGGAAIETAITPLTEGLMYKTILGQVGKNLTKKELLKLSTINVVKDGLIGTGNLLTQGVISPFTYDGMARKFVGQTQLITDGNGDEKVLITASGRKGYEKYAKNRLTILGQRENELNEKVKRTPDEEKQLLNIKNEKYRIKKELNSIYDPNKKGNNIIKDMSAWDSFIYGYTENIKETGSEMYVGEWAGKIGKLAGNKLSGTFLDKITKPLVNTYNAGRKTVNNTILGKISGTAMYHTGMPKIFHGIPEEILEEVATQLTPTYKEDYLQQFKELGNPTFYLDIISQTLLLGGGFTAIGATQHGYKYATSKKYRKENRDFRQKKKLIRELYENIDKSITDEQLAEHIVMSTGGTLFEVQDYQAKVAKLRKDGKKEEANKLEEKSFLNIAVNALNTGTINSFEKSLNKVSRNIDLSEETRNNAIRALKYIPELKKIDNKYGEHLNKNELYGLAANKIFYRESVKDIDNKIKEIETSILPEIEQYKKFNGLTNETFSFFDIYNKLKLDETGEYTKFIQGLRKEKIEGVDDLINLAYIKDIYEQANYDNNKVLREKSSQEYQEKLRKKYKEFRREQLKKTTNSSNIKETKKEIKNREGKIDPETTAKLNDAAVESATSNKNPGEEEIKDVDIPKAEISEEDIINARGLKEVLSEEAIQQYNNLEAPDKNIGEPITDEPIPIQNKNTTVIPEGQSLMSPIIRNENDENQNKKIDSLTTDFKNFLKKYPDLSFGGLVVSLMNHHGANSIDRNFNFIKEAWEKASGQKVTDRESEKLYNSIFPKLESNTLSNNIEEKSDQPSVQEIKYTDTSTTTKQKEYNPITNEVEKVEFIRDGDRRYNGTGLKLGGVLGKEYGEGEIDGKFSVTNEVNETAKPFIDWRNFLPGAEVEFVFNIDYLLNTENLTTSWSGLDTENPQKHFTTTKEKLEKIFKGQYTYDEIVTLLEEYKEDKNPNNPLFQNKEFHKIVPIGVVNNGYVIDNVNGNPEIIQGGLNDYYWFNNSNVALRKDKNTGKPMLEEREQRIEANRQINLKARQAILNNGSFSATISEKQDKETNIRLLKTEEEKEQGYTNDFFSILSQFGNNIEEFEKNATIAHLDGNFTLVESRKNNNEPVIATIDGVEVTEDKIINFKEFKESIKDSGFVDGRTVLIHKSGVDSNGDNVYTIHNVINNHNSKQEEFKRTSKIVEKLFSDVINIKESDSQYKKDRAEKIKKAFKEQFGIELNKFTKKILTQLYPEYVKTKEGKRTKILRQDYKSKAQTKGFMDNIPDLRQFENFNDFVEQLLNGKVKTINKKQLLLESLHTNLVFTPIEKNGETIYTTDSQPYMMFESPIQEEYQGPTKKQIINENLKRLERRKEYLEEQLEKATDETTKIEIKKEINNNNKEIKKNKVANQTIESLPQEKNNDNAQDAEQTNNYDSEIEYLEDESNKNEILGITKFEDSAREYLLADLGLDPTEDAELLDSLYKKLQEEYDLLIQELKEKEYDGSNDNTDNYKYDIIEELVSRTLNKIFKDDIKSDIKYNEKDHNKASYEVDITQSLSGKVKLLLAGIKDQRLGKGFAGFYGNMSLSDALDALHQILSEVNNNSLEDIENVIKEKIKKNPKEFEFYNTILERLKEIEKTNPEILNEILYNLYQPKIDMKFIMWRMDNNGKFVLENYDANVKNPLFIKRSQWLENLKLNGLVDLYEGQYYKINENKYREAKELYNIVRKQYDENQDINNVDRKSLEKLLSLYGIKLNEQTLDNIFNEKSQNDMNILSMLFKTKNGILDVLNKNLNNAKNSNKKLSFKKVENKENEKQFNILTFDNSQINDLIKSDNFVEFIPMNTMYIAGKTINMYQQPNSIYNKIKSIISSLRKGQDENGNWQSILKDFEQSSITSNSMLLELLKSDKKLSSYFNTFLMSLESLKENGTKSREDMNITTLSDKDTFITLFGMFVSSEGNISNIDMESRGIKLRKGMMSFPTLSDSSQLQMLKTILIEINSDNINLENDTLNENILGVLREQLLISDLKRVGNYINNIKDSNISGFDDGAIWITGMTSLNTLQIKVKDKNTGETVKRPLIKVFRDEIENSSDIDSDISTFIEKYKDEINKEITENITDEVDKLVSKDLQSGQFAEFELLDEGRLKLDDGKLKGYFNNKHPRMVAYDYVINYMLQQKEIQTIFAGDLAQYFKNGMSENLRHGSPQVTEEDVLTYGDESLLKYLDDRVSSDIDHEEAYQALLPVQQMKVNEMFKEVQNNLSKRLKELLSPGNQFADVQNQKSYIQIMVSDVENASETIEDLVDRYYPDLYNNKDFMSDLREFKKLDENYNKNQKQTNRHKSLKKKIEKQIPNISAYLKTASTDAQEYVTWQDNLNQLRQQGRISNIEYETIKNKLENQEKDLEESDNIKQENRLTKEEMSVAMMQPSKPLYSGLQFEEINGQKVPRYIYIKSSSFPLMPELTEKFPKLNQVRKAMNKVGKESNGIVRLSYQSANKVGAVKNTITIADLYKDDIDINKIRKSSVTLNRENFYIQQDKPFKGDKNSKNGKRDEITRATQFEKIILGDGINKLGYVFPSHMFDKDLLKELNIEDKDGMLSGPDLKNIYNSIYQKEQKILANKLFNELGIDSYNDIQQGKPEAMEGLIKLLNRRLNNKQDRKSLELLYLDSNGISHTKQEVLEKNIEVTKAIFKIPLFMTPNSKKFESVLNSIINNNSINLKLPGLSSPVASQEGFDFKGYDGNLEELKRKGLITTKNFDPSKGLQSQRDSKTGKLKYAQVFMSNKFKVYNKGTQQYEYIDLKEFVDENGQIDTSKLPEDLLSMFSFRIPTSSHQSGTVIEIAGFLPHNQGDLMIVPKDHTVQIGEDYDIDVRYMYQYNYIKDKNGNLKKLDYSDIEKPKKTIDELKQEFEDYKKELFNSFYTQTVNSKKPLEIKLNLNNPYWKQNRNKLMEIAILQNKLDNYEVDGLLNAIFQDKYERESLSKQELQEKILQLENELIPSSIVKDKSKLLKGEYREIKKLLVEAFKNEKSELYKKWNNYNNAYSQKANERKVLENNLIAMYKSVFSSPNEDVQQLITKVLSTNYSEDSASLIDNKLSNHKQKFNIYSPSTQRKVMKLGADGKMGIGVHSNAITINSLLQQLDNQFQFIYYYDKDSNTNVPYNIILGNNTFDGKLGKITDGKRRISEYLMESQNSSTDNQKLEIMGRRNENSETINVFSLLQLSGLEDDGISVNGQDASYASLFISQPIIQDYVQTVKKFKSSTNNDFGSPEKLAIKYIEEKYRSQVPDKYWARNKLSGEPEIGFWNHDEKNKLAKTLNSNNLYNQLQPLENTEGINYAAQYYIFEAFSRLKNPAKELGELQKFVNIESGGLGISYFNTIDLKNQISKIRNLQITTTGRFGKNLETVSENTGLFNEMFGDYKIVNNEDIPSNLDNGYIYISENGSNTSIMVKPNNHYSHKIMNSISQGYNLWNSLFPYDNNYINEQIKTIIEESGINSESKEAMDLRYNIMASMKDYSYSLNHNLFQGTITKYQEELFFNNKEIGQESLGSYLQRIKNDPSYRYLFRKPFFKDLQIEINDDTYPTIIKFQSGDRSNINNIKMYNTLESMINSKKLLPEKLNGKQMTEAELMKELLMYSIIADQANGAIGFRHLLPLSLFEKYKVDEILRTRNDINAPQRQNIIYNGLNKSVESLLGSKTNQDGIIKNNKKVSINKLKPIVKTLNDISKNNRFIILDNGDIVNTEYNPSEENQSVFVRQYFQHNPDKIKRPITYSNHKKSTFRQIMRENNLKVSDFDKGTVNKISTTNDNRKYIVFKDKRGGFQLFEKYNQLETSSEDLISYYKRIPLLGTFGFNEYRVGKDVNQSKVQKNNFEEISTGNQPINVQNVKDFINKSDLKTILNIMMNDATSHYSPLIKIIKNFVPNINNVEITTTNGIPGNAVFKDNKILISEEFLNDSNTTRKKVHDVIMEEFLHYITTNTINDYVKMTGISPDGKLKYEVVKDEKGKPKTIPAPLQTLLSVYNQAIKHYVKKHGVESLLAKQNKYKNIIKGDANSSLSVDKNLGIDSYRTMNIHEFIAGLFIKDSDFINEMANTQYLKSGESILAKFAKKLAQLLQRILPNTRQDTISANGVNALIKFLEEHHNKVNNKLTKKIQNKSPLNKLNNNKIIIETQKLVNTGDATLTHKKNNIEQDGGRFSEVITTVRETLKEEGFKNENIETQLAPIINELPNLNCE